MKKTPPGVRKPGQTPKEAAENSEILCRRHKSGRRAGSNAPSHQSAGVSRVQPRGRRHTKRPSGDGQKK